MAFNSLLSIVACSEDERKHGKGFFVKCKLGTICGEEVVLKGAFFGDIQILIPSQNYSAQSFNESPFPTINSSWCVVTFWGAEVIINNLISFFSQESIYSAACPSSLLLLLTFRKALKEFFDYRPEFVYIAILVSKVAEYKNGLSECRFCNLDSCDNLCLDFLWFLCRESKAFVSRIPIVTAYILEASWVSTVYYPF